MRTPLAAWRAGVRWPLALIAPARRARRRDPPLRSDRLAVPGRADPAPARSDARSPRRPRRRPASAPRAFASACSAASASAPRSIEIGAPTWSPTPHTLLVRDASAEARLPRPLACLARRAPAHRRPRGGVARRPPRAPRRRPRVVAVRQEAGGAGRSQGGAAADLRPARRRRRARALCRRGAAGRRRRALRAQRGQRSRRQGVGELAGERLVCCVRRRFGASACGEQRGKRRHRHPRRRRSGQCEGRRQRAPRARRKRACA